MVLIFQETLIFHFEFYDIMDDDKRRKKGFECPKCGDIMQAKCRYRKSPFMMIRYRVCRNEQCRYRLKTVEKIDLSNPSNLFKSEQKEENEC